MTDSVSALMSGANSGIGEAIARGPVRNRMDGCRWACANPCNCPTGPIPIVSGRSLRCQRMPAANGAWVDGTHYDAFRPDRRGHRQCRHHDPEESVIEADDADLDAHVRDQCQGAAPVWPPRLGMRLASGRGRVIILGSLSGKRVKSSTASLYSISKFAAVALAHGIRHTGWDLGIRATALCPGFVATDMARGLTNRA